MKQHWELLSNQIVLEHAASTAGGYTQTLKTQKKQSNDKALSQTHKCVERTRMEKVYSTSNSTKFAPLAALIQEPPKAKSNSELQSGGRLPWFPNSTFAAHLQIAVSESRRPWVFICS